MKKNIYLYICSALLSLILIGLLMIFVFDKPLIIGWGKTAYDLKYLHYAQSTKQNNIIIVAGSNGFFSHRCETIEQVLNKNCTNYSVSAGLGLDYILEKSKEVINKNTIVILPLEFGFYNGSKEDSIKANTGNLHILENDHNYIFKFGFKRTLYILFSKDFKYIIGSILENILDK
ncbi:MAG: hypothetical protein JKX75_01875, partial [Gammaproteobacteria bacterium]|nr:hypothetical protein [Gammaproteobacteria bacterium]